MPVLYVFVSTTGDQIFRQEQDNLFYDSERQVASEAFLTSLTCGDNAAFVRLNAYRIKRDTCEFTTGDIFASKVSDPTKYCLLDAQYAFADRCLFAEDVSQNDWFEQVYFQDDYL